jgi:hypothetical protein
VVPGAKKRRTGRNAAIVGGVALLLVVVGAAAMPLASGASVDVTTNKDMAARFLSADAVKDLTYTVTSDKLGDVKLTWDGQPVEGVREGDALVFRPQNVGEGKHEFAATAKGKFGRSAGESHTFEVDSIAPIVAVDKQENVPSEGPFVLTGSIEGAKAVKIDDKDVALDGGRFRVEYPKAPLAVKIWAQDEAGNVTEQNVSVGSSVRGVRSAHITGHGWASSALREPLLQLVKDKKLDDIQLDIKDEDGVVSYDSQVPLAKQAGTTQNYYDLKSAVDTIHGLGATVTGRIVAFRDPKLGKWAVQNGKLDMLIQNESGGPYTTKTYGTGAFTNFVNPEIIEYNIALGEEAARAGFDSIMFDYVRKPENKGQVYKGIGTRTPEQGIVDFLAAAAPRIRSAGATLGAAVYGVAAFTPWTVAQDIPEMSKHLDYIAPMIYPSHWASGEYSVSDPKSMPYPIVKRSLMDFNRMVLAGNPKCAIIPWQQSFSWPIKWSPDDVLAQLKAAKDVGINSFFLWNASAKYDLAAPILTPGDPSGNAPGQIVYSNNRPGNASEGTTNMEDAKRYIEAYVAWDKGGRQGSFQDPLRPTTTGTTGTTDTSGTTDSTGTTGTTDTTGTTPASPVTGQAPATPSTTTPTTEPSSAPSVAATSTP